MEPYEHTYLIVGGGMAADSAVGGIRAEDPEASIGMISADQHMPYDRPPLSKDLWKGGSEQEIWRQTGEMDVQILLNQQVMHIDPQDKQVRTQDGRRYSYEKLLLATGGTPRRLPFGEEHILYYRTFEDYRQLRRWSDHGEKFAVIGGGFIGSEIAAALALQDNQVSMVFPEKGIGALQFPGRLASFLNQYYQEQGVEVLPGVKPVGLKPLEDHHALQLDDGRQILVDGVVAGIGIEPNTDLAETVGLAVDDGIVVNAELETSLPDIYAAGDVAAFHAPGLNRRIRVEHEDNANKMGEMAGRSMAGAPVAYEYLPMFYSDLFDMGYEAVGVLNSSLEMVQDWHEPFQKGVVYYLQDGQVQGVLLWNLWGQVEAARDLIQSESRFDSESLIGRIQS